MKLLTIATTFFAAFAIATPLEGAKAAEEVLTDSDEGQVIQLGVNYSLEEFPEIDAFGVAEFTNGETVTILHTATNNEAEKITVVGVGGSFLDANSKQPVVSLTDSAVGPLIVEPNESITFRQAIPLDVPAGNYVLAPKLYIALDDNLKAVPLRGQLATVSDIAVSWFDPHLLVLEGVFGALVVGVVYAIVSSWGNKYVKGTAPVKQSDWLPKEYKKKKKA